MLVSVVMAVYNARDVVLDAVADILAQTYEDLELIVVDDGSSDDTVELVSAVQDPRLRVIALPVNGRQASALNAGVAAAKGAVIGRMDADDRCAPTRIERTMDVLTSRPTIGLVGTAGYIWDVESDARHLWMPPTTNAGLQRGLLDSTGVLHGSVVFRKDLFDLVGGYRPRFEPAEDYDLWLRLAEVSEVANVPEPLFTYARHSASLSAVHDDRQRANLRAGRAAAIARRSGGTDELGHRIPPVAGSLMRRNQAAWVRRLVRRGRVKDVLLVLSGVGRVGR